MYTSPGTRPAYDSAHAAFTRLRRRAVLAFACVGLALPAWAISIPVLESGVGRVGRAELEQALGLLQQGRTEEASVLVERYLAIDPKSVPGQELRAVVHVLAGRVDEGLETLLRVVNQDPTQSTAWTKIGDIHRSRGDLGAAKICFQRALAASPEDRHANQRLGLMLEDEGEMAGAIEHLEKGVLGTTSDYVGVKVNLGSLYNRTGQFRRTVELLRPVLGESVVHPAGHLTLGAAQLALGNSLEALQAFERAKRGTTDPVQTAMALGIAYRNVGKWEESLAEFRLVLDERADHPAARFQMAETLYAMKRIPEAVEAWEAAAADKETSVLASIRQAEALSEAGQTEAALARLERLDRQGKASPRSQLLRARVYERSGRLEEAGKVLQEASTAYPQNAEVRLRRGLHLGLTGRYSEAVEMLEQTCALAPGEPRAWKGLALALVRQNQWEKAVAATRRLLELVPKSTADRFFLGSILESAGKDPEARKAYEQVLALNPNDVASLNNLAVVLSRQKEWARAMEVAKRATELAPGEAVVWDTLGWVQAQAGRVPEARVSLARAVSFPQAKPLHRYHHAVVLERAGETRLALEEVERALQDGADFSERKAAEALRTRLRQVK